jgi:ankyrin repeat protein
MSPTWKRAAMHGDADAARQVLQSGEDIDGRDRYGNTALMLAAQRGHRALVELLIENGADLNVTAKYHLSALMLAVVAGHSEIAQRLARAGARLDIQGSGAPGFSGKTAYDLAIAREMTEVFEVLLQPR